MDDRPNIYFICVHKGASTFVAGHLLPSIATQCPDYSTYMIGKRYLDWYLANRERLGMEPTLDRTLLSRRMVQMLADDPLPRSNCLVGRLYPDYLTAISKHLNEPFPPANSRVFVMRRDPRDALVSMYYSLAFSHDKSALLIGRESAAIDERRRELQMLGVYRWIADTLSKPDNKEIVEEFESCAELLQNHPQIVDLPYEMLISNPRKWLETFVEKAGLSDVLDIKWYRLMLKQFVIPETVDISQHKRRMTPGNWKEVFDEQLALLLSERVGQQMQQLEYPWQK
jgi:Sulfotransferase domain